MPEQAAKKAEVAPEPKDAVRAPGRSDSGGGQMAGAMALPGLVRPTPGVAGRLPPSTIVALQRRAGNRAVTSLVVQRNGGQMPLPPDEELIKDGIENRSAARIKQVRKLGAAKFEDKIKMIDILTDQFWVGPNDETALETLWGSFGDGVLDTAS